MVNIHIIPTPLLQFADTVINLFKLRQTRWHHQCYSFILDKASQMHYKTIFTGWWVNWCAWVESVKTPFENSWLSLSLHTLGGTGTRQQNTQCHKNTECTWNFEVSVTCQMFSHLAGVLGFDARVVDELNKNRVTAAQKSVKVDDFLWWWGQSTEKQIIVEVAQIITVQGQPGCRLAYTKGLIP